MSAALKNPTLPKLAPPPGSRDVVPNAQRAPGVPTLTAPQKAALVITALGPEAAGPIIERIEDKHMRAFARAYAHLQTVPKATLQNVVAEFLGQFSKDDDEIKGGYEETRELLSQFVTSDKIIHLMEDIDEPGGDSIWTKLERAPDNEFAEYLSKQNTQVVAVVLSKINTEKASTILDLLEVEVAQQVIIRLSRPLNIQREALAILSDTIEREFLSPMKSSSEKRNPGEMIGSMMNNIMSEKREELLKFISEDVPDILKDVRKTMLTFQDIATRVPAKAMPMVIKEMEVNDFLQAVKFGRQNAPSSVEFIFANISQRMVQQYEEQIEALKTVTVKEAETAQTAFMVIVRKLVAAGEIELIEIASEEEDPEDAAAASEDAEASA